MDPTGKQAWQISVAAAVVLTGIILSGPVAVVLVEVLAPQPKWQSVATFIEHYSWLQSLPYVFGFFIAGGFILLVSSVPVGDEDGRRPLRSVALQQSLGVEGFEVTVVEPCPNFQEIFDELSRTDYHMVLLTNNGLPPKGIPRLVRDINRRFPRLKVMVMSGYRTKEFELELDHAGMDAFLPLPFDYGELVAGLNGLRARNSPMFWLMKMVRSNLRKLSWNRRSGQ